MLNGCVRGAWLLDFGVFRSPSRATIEPEFAGNSARRGGTADGFCEGFKFGFEGRDFDGADDKAESAVEIRAAASTSGAAIGAPGTGRA